MNKKIKDRVYKNIALIAFSLLTVIASIFGKKTDALGLINDKDRAPSEIN